MVYIPRYFFYLVSHIVRWYSYSTFCIMAAWYLTQYMIHAASNINSFNDSYFSSARNALNIPTWVLIYLVTHNT